MLFESVCRVDVNLLSIFEGLGREGAIRPKTEIDGVTGSVRGISISKDGENAMRLHLTGSAIASGYRIANKAVIASVKYS
jgi:hypothetical protein